MFEFATARAVTAQVVCVILVTLCTSLAHANSLRFFGNGFGDIDRVKIRIDDPARPADIGDTDFTIEFWLRGFAADFTPSGDRPNGFCVDTDGDEWTNGNIVLDRALWGETFHGDFGLAVYLDGVAFGTRRGNSAGVGLCGTTDVLDGQWHHIAVTRELNTGRVRLFVDGNLEDDDTGNSGNVSYDENRSFGNGDDNTDPYLVIGAEKYDIGSDFPAFNGWVDELRLSTTIRYTGNFARPSAPFSPDGNTVGLYHFDEGSGTTRRGYFGRSSCKRRFHQRRRISPRTRLVDGNTLRFVRHVVRWVWSGGLFGG